MPTPWYLPTTAAYRPNRGMLGAIALMPVTAALKPRPATAPTRRLRQRGRTGPLQQQRPSAQAQSKRRTRITRSLPLTPTQPAAASPLALRLRPIASSAPWTDVPIGTRVPHAFDSTL